MTGLLGPVGVIAASVVGGAALGYLAGFGVVWAAVPPVVRHSKIYGSHAGCRRR